MARRTNEELNQMRQENMKNFGQPWSYCIHHPDDIVVQTINDRNIEGGPIRMARRCLNCGTRFDKQGNRFRIN